MNIDHLIQQIERERRMKYVLERFENQFSEQRYRQRVEISYELAALTTLNFDKFKELFVDNYLNSEDYQNSFSHILDDADSLNLTSFQKLCEFGLTHENPKIRSTVIKTLGKNANKHGDLIARLANEGSIDIISLSRELDSNQFLSFAGRFPEISLKLVEEGIKDKYEPTRIKYAEHLGIFLNINEQRYFELLREVVNDERSVRTSAFKSLKILAKHNPTKFIETLKEFSEYMYSLRDAGINQDILIENKDLEKFPKSIYPVNKVDIESYLHTLESKLKFSRDEALERIAFTIGYVAKIDQELYLSLFEKGIADNRLDIAKSTAETLGSLAKINPEKYVELFKKTILDSRIEVSEKIARTLPTLAETNVKQFSLLYEEGITNSRNDIAEIISESLEKLIGIDFAEYLKLFEKTIGHPEYNVRKNALKSLNKLSRFNPEIYLDFSKKVDSATKINFSYISGMEKTNPHIYLQLIESESNLNSFEPSKMNLSLLTAFAYSLSSESLIPFKDEEFIFLKLYLNSKYSSVNAPPIEELRRIINIKNKNYKAMTSILEKGKAKDLDEIIECASLNIPNYEVIKKLGQGAFSNVYLARNTLENKEYAIKILDSNKFSELGKKLIKDSGLTEEQFIFMELQASKLNGLRDKHITLYHPPIKGSDGSIYVIMEPFEKTIEEVMNENKLSKIHAIDYFMQMAETLINAYNEERVVHKDLKLTNIGIHKKGYLQLTDFGSLEMLTSDAQSDMCSIDTMAPEFIDEKKATFASSLWSLGAVFYKILTGKYPFSPEDIDKKTNREEYQKAVYGSLMNISEGEDTLIKQRLEELPELGLGNPFTQIFIEGGILSMLSYCLEKDPVIREKKVLENYSSFKSGLCAYLKGNDNIIIRNHEVSDSQHFNKL